jgi:choline dehydrogenase-like flavoprotein
MLKESHRAELWDVVIIGAGAAGAAAALALTDLRVLMLDVGIQPPPNPLPNVPLYALREQTPAASGPNLHSVLLGDRYESLGPVRGEEISPKLKAPCMRYLSYRPPSFPQDREEGFTSVQSFSAGGLANGWGAGVLRYNDQDLQGFPFGSSELAPFYDRLTDHIGINGAHQDDLTEYLGSSHGLLPPMPLSPIAATLLRRYSWRRRSLYPRGIKIGRTRAAILTQPFRGRAAFTAFGHDFFWGPQEAIYSPLFTIRELTACGGVTYQPTMRVTHFDEQAGSVRIYAEDTSSGEHHQFTAKRIIVAAGAINSARIVLRSRNDTTTQLPLLDNPVSFVPAVDPLKIGTPLQTSSFIGGELLLLLPGERPERPVQGSVYGLLGPLRTDLVREFPLSIRGNLAASRYLVPALLMVQLFYPDEPSPHSTLRLTADGSLSITRRGRLTTDREREVCKILRGLGYLAFEQLCVRPIPGSSIHYAGTLPMSSSSSDRYSTDRAGLLRGTTRVYIADAATFPSLPAKNHTFTLMANAMRIATEVGRSLRNEPKNGS